MSHGQAANAPDYMTWPQQGGENETSTSWGLRLFNMLMENTQMSGMDEWRWRPDVSQVRKYLFIDTDKYRLNSVELHLYSSTHQLPLLHALHNHEQDLLRLAFAVVESLLNGHQKLLSDVIINQAGGGGGSRERFSFLPEEY